MSEQLSLMETSPLVEQPKGIINIARGVFRNLDTGITWSMHSKPWCCAIRKTSDPKHPMGELCMRGRGHGGRHRHRSVASGTWVRTRWTDAECYVSEHQQAGPPAKYGADSPRRELPLASKQSIRRKALRRRMMKKNPIFVEDEITAAFEKQPDYYGGIRP